MDHMACVQQRGKGERRTGWRWCCMDLLALCMFDDDKERLRQLTDKHINYQVWQTVQWCCAAGSGLRHRLITDYRSKWTLATGWVDLYGDRRPSGGLQHPAAVVPSPPSDGHRTATAVARPVHICPRPSCLFAFQMQSIRRRRRRRRPEDHVTVELIADIRVSIADRPSAPHSQYCLVTAIVQLATWRQCAPRAAQRPLAASKRELAAGAR